MESVLINRLVPLEQQREIRQMDKDLSPLITAGLEDSVLGDEMEDLCREIIFKEYENGVSYFPLLYRYIELLRLENRQNDPVLAYAYGMQTRLQGGRYQLAYAAYQSDISSSPKMLEIVEARGRCRTALYAVLGERDEVTHPVDRIAKLYRQIYDGADRTAEFFCKLGYRGGFTKTAL